MKANNRFINLVMLISLLGALVLTAHEYAVCESDLPDEFLDLAVAYQNLTLPVFAPHLNIGPILISLLKTARFQKANLTASLRC